MRCLVRCWWTTLALECTRKFSVSNHDNNVSPRFTFLQISMLYNLNVVSFKKRDECDWVLCTIESRSWYNLLHSSFEMYQQKYPVLMYQQKYPVLMYQQKYPVLMYQQKYPVLMFVSLIKSNPGNIDSL